VRKLPQRSQVRFVGAGLKPALTSYINRLSGYSLASHREHGITPVPTVVVGGG
jgi:hypothetical protein